MRIWLLWSGPNSLTSALIRRTSSKLRSLQTAWAKGIGLDRFVPQDLIVRYLMSNSKSWHIQPFLGDLWPGVDCDYGPFMRLKLFLSKCNGFQLSLQIGTPGCPKMTSHLWANRCPAWLDRYSYCWALREGDFVCLLVKYPPISPR